MAKKHEIAKARREGFNLTLTDLGTISGVSAATISRYERGIEVGDLFERCIWDALDKLKYDVTRAEWHLVDMKARMATLDLSNKKEAVNNLAGIIKDCSSLIFEINKVERE